MKKIFLFIFLILFFTPKVYALSNYDTSYTITVPYISKFDTEYIDNSNHTYFDFFEGLLSLDSDYYHLITRFYICSDYTPCGFGLYLLPKSQNFISTSSAGLNYSNRSIFALYWLNRPSEVQSSNTYNYGIVYTSNSSKPSNIYSSSAYTDFLSCYTENSCSGNSWDSIQGTFRYNSIVFNNSSSFSLNYQSDSISSWSSPDSFIYSSSVPIHVTDGGLSSNAFTPYFKNLVVNGVNYPVGSVLPTYRNLYFSSSNDYTSLDSLGNIYIGSIPKNNLNNFQATFTYGFNDENYVNSIDYKYLFFGRVNHGTYYSYENIDCSSSVLSSTAINTSNKIATTTFFPYGITCTSDLTNYDNIYIRIYNTYDINTDTTVKNFNGTLSTGYYSRLSDVRATSNASYIYEHFDDLDSSFSFMLSTSQSINWAYYETSNQYVASLQVNRQNNSLSSLISNPISYGVDSNTNAIIYNMGNYYSDNTSLDLFINYNTILSFNSSDDSINGTYTYYDSDNTIHTGTVTNNHLIVVSDSYDLSYYFLQVNDFIDSMVLDIQNFSTITQLFYDSAPEFLQIFILCVFILLCIYFLYLLIRRR